MGEMSPGPTGYGSCPCDKVLQYPTDAQLGYTLLGEVPKDSSEKSRICYHNCSS
jgi:hypothetical protein